MAVAGPTQLKPSLPKDRSWVLLLSHELGGPITVLRGYASIWGELGERMEPDTELLAQGLSHLLDSARSAKTVADPALHRSFRYFESQARPATRRLHALLANAGETPALADCLQASMQIEALVEQLAVALRVATDDGIEWQLVELGAWTRALVHEVAAPAAVTGHRLLMQGPRDPARARVTPGPLRAAVVNLIDNAQKHSPPGTPILVAVRTLPEQVAIHVADRGPGLPEAGLVAAPFQRVEQPISFALPGLGLGLMIAARAAELNYGRLVYKQREGGGAEFAIELSRTT